jgi:hypothetical protein
MTTGAWCGRQQKAAVCVASAAAAEEGRLNMVALSEVGGTAQPAVIKAKTRREAREWLKSARHTINTDALADTVGEIEMALDLLGFGKLQLVDIRDKVAMARDLANRASVALGLEIQNLEGQV